MPAIQATRPVPISKKPPMTSTHMPMETRPTGTALRKMLCRLVKLQNTGLIREKITTITISTMAVNTGLN